MEERTMMARIYLRNISTKSRFYDLLDKLMLSSTERKVLELHYLGDKELDWIADELGYSVQKIKKEHKQSLLKVYDYIRSKD